MALATRFRATRFGTIALTARRHRAGAFATWFRTTIAFTSRRLRPFAIATRLGPLALAARRLRTLAVAACFWARLFWTRLFWARRLGALAVAACLFAPRFRPSIGAFAAPFGFTSRLGPIVVAPLGGGAVLPIRLFLIGQHGGRAWAERRQHDRAGQRLSPRTL
jgi:hypothetical protein